jgi:hypothetical protein
MSASLGDVVIWLMPLVIGAVVSLCGLLTLLLGRFDPGSGLEVRGVAAVVLGLLALPVLPLAFFINPSLAQRAAWAAETETWQQRSRERQERKKAIAERRKEIKGKLAALDKTAAKPTADPLEALLKRMREELKKTPAERAKETATRLAQSRQRQQLQQESLDLHKEELALTTEELRDYDRLGSVRRGRPRDPMPYLLPLGWGASLLGLGWLLGRKKSIAKQTTAAEPASGVPAAVPGPAQRESAAEPGSTADLPRGGGGVPGDSEREGADEQL